jgi:hypothetical protein
MQIASIAGRFVANGEAIFATLLSFAIFIVAAVATRRAVRLSHADTTSGTIIDYADRSDSEGASFTTVFRFEVDGREVIGESMSGLIRRGSIGLPVKVRYDPRNPKRASIENPRFDRTVAATLWLVGLVVLWTAWQTGG